MLSNIHMAVTNKQFTNMSTCCFIWTDKEKLKAIQVHQTKIILYGRQVIYGLTEIAGLDNDGRIWAIDCNQLKITIERFYQLTGTYNSFESVLYLKTYKIHIDKQKL